MKYYDTYDYTYNSTIDSVAAGILAIYLIILAVMFLFYLISYVFKGIGMYTIAKRQGMDYPWLAFIPFARTYLHGELGGSIKLKNKSIKNPGIWLLALPFIFGAVMFAFYMIFWIVGMGAFTGLMSNSFYAHDSYGYGPSNVSAPMVMGLIIILLFWLLIALIYKAVITVLGVLVNHQIFEKFTTKNMSVAHAVLCTVIPLYESICLFVMRNREFNPGMEPDLGRPFMQMPVPPMPPYGGVPGGNVPGPGPYGAADMQAAPPEPERTQREPIVNSEAAAPSEQSPTEVPSGQFSAEAPTEQSSVEAPLEKPSVEAPLGQSSVEAPSEQTSAEEKE